MFLMCFEKWNKFVPSHFSSIRQLFHHHDRTFCKRVQGFVNRENAKTREISISKPLLYQRLINGCAKLLAHGIGAGWDTLCHVDGDEVFLWVYDEDGFSVATPAIIAN